jgi:pimeloyl-ACP methyl ester carboxylesterase
VNCTCWHRNRIAQRLTAAESTKYLRTKMTQLQRQRFTVFVCLFLPYLLVYNSLALAQDSSLYYAELKNGLRIGPGRIRQISTISQNKAEIANQVGKPEAIYQLDDNLRSTFFNKSPKNVQTVEFKGQMPEVIELPYKQEIESSGGEFAVQGLLGLSDFNKYGRRTYSILVPTRNGAAAKHLLQAITELSPNYAKVEVLRVSDSFAWDQRISPWTIPGLNDILHHHLDLTKPGEWLRIVKFYLQGEHYKEARDELEAALKKFPDELASQRELLEQINTLHANRLFREAKIRQAAGQHQLAAEFLLKFPMASLPLEVQISVQDQVQKLKTDLKLVQDIIGMINSDVQSLKPEDLDLVKPLVDEIVAEVNLESVIRLDDYLRLRADEALKIEQRVALALSGWILGSGAGIDNFSTAKSLIKVRQSVHEYLVAPDEIQRGQALDQVKAQEGGLPENVLKILAHIKPPLTPPAVHADDPKGLHRMKVAVGDGFVEYLVQTPPEYDPNRVYPCLLTLPGIQSSPQFQINFWCGDLAPVALSVEDPAKEISIKDYQRFGQATRHGYIVVSPAWTVSGQGAYNYTEMEHLRILRSYRDALRHFSIDTDRVFISGHHAGATAAWDIALAHPDLWAGAIIMSPTADKHIIQYSEKNAKYVPFYVVWGDVDGSGFREKIGTSVGKYVNSADYDVIAVSYQGRESGYFAEELPRITEWMQLSSHVRPRVQPDLDLYASRPGDDFFYWLEAGGYTTKNNPITFDMKDREVFEGSINPTSNRISIRSIPSKKASLWLTPDLVDFKRPLVVQFRTATAKTFQDLQPDVSVILEDARSRADRLHPYQIHIEVP